MTAGSSELSTNTATKVTVLTQMSGISMNNSCFADKIEIDLTTGGK